MGLSIQTFLSELIVRVCAQKLINIYYSERKSLKLIPEF